MTEKKSTNPKDVLASGEQRVLLHLIPSPALIETAKAMMDGARKYGPYNWRAEGVGASTYISAAMRHLRAWLDGEENAEDSGVHHLGHAMACLAILLDSIAVGNLVDDRPPPAPTAKLMDALKRAPVNFIPAEDIYEEDWPFPSGSDIMQEAPKLGNRGLPTWEELQKEVLERGELRREVRKLERVSISPIPPESEGPGGCC